MPVLIAAVMTMSAAQLLDLMTFNAMVRHVGPAAEANPLVGLLFGLYGYPIVAIAKVVLLAFATAIAAILAARMRPRLAGAVITAGIAVGLIGGISNVVALGLL
jgi:hypothetical protein